MIILTTILFTYLIVTSYLRINVSSNVYYLTDRWLLAFYWLFSNILIECLFTFIKCDNNGIKDINPDIDCYTRGNIVLMILTYIMIFLIMMFCIVFSLYDQNSEFLAVDHLSQYLIIIK